MQVPHSHLTSKAAAGYHPLMTWVKGYAPGRPKIFKLLSCDLQLMAKNYYLL